MEENLAAIRAREEILSEPGHQEKDGETAQADLPPHHFRGCFEKARGYSDFSCKM
jgi:hypothetical protein